MNNKTLPALRRHLQQGVPPGLATIVTNAFNSATSATASATSVPPGLVVLNRRAFVADVLAMAGIVAFDTGSILSLCRSTIAEAASGTGIITTIVGGGSIGMGGPATMASISAPFGMTFDSVGYLYIADNYYNRVYRVAAATGVITSVAGTGIPGYSGDGGLAITARLACPFGLAMDAQGTLYIADSGNGSVRRVDNTSGIITTIAGTGVTSIGYNGDGIPATSALLNNPRGIAVDASGNVYIADMLNYRVRVVNMGTAPLVLFPAGPAPLTVQPGQIATVVGTGVLGATGDGGPATEAQISMTGCPAFDNNGNLYIADCLNQRVRMIAAASGLISTVAGTGVKGVAGDGGPAAAARLLSPSAVAVDNQSNLYISSLTGTTVRKVDGQTKIISTVAGTATIGFGGDGSPATKALLNAPSVVALDPQQSLCISDYNNARIRRVNASTQVITTVAGSSNVGDQGSATSATLNQPGGLACDTSSQLYIADEGDHRIRLVNTSGNISTVAGVGTSGYGGDSGPATSAYLNLPVDVKLDSAGNLYIADLGNQRIRRVDARTRTISTVAGSGKQGYSGDNGPATAALLNGPRGVALDTGSNLYIADMFNARVRFVNRSAQPFTLYQGSANALTVQPGAITTIAGTGVVGYSGDGGPAVRATLNSPRALTVDAQGNLYIVEGSDDPTAPTLPTATPGSLVRKIDARTGVISTVAGTSTSGYNGDNIPATNAQLFSPHAVAIDALGNLYICDCFNSRIRRVDAQTGTITTVVGTGKIGFGGDGGPAGQATLYFPRCVALDSAGNLLVNDMGNARIRRVMLT